MLLLPLLPCYIFDFHNNMEIINFIKIMFEIFSVNCTLPGLR